MRASLRLRGVGVPTRGSLAEAILVEMHQRERWNQVAFWELSAKVMGLLLGVEPKGLYKVLDAIKPELNARVFHKVYDRNYLLDQLFTQRAAVEAEKNRMKKLDKLTAE